MAIQEEIRDALARDTPLSVAECNAFLPRLDAETAEALGRLVPVHPGGNHDFQHPGEQYRAALLSGSTEKVTEVRATYERLQSEYDILRSFRGELIRQRTIARTREAFENLPQLQATLVAKLDGVDAVRRALADAVAEVDAAYTAVTQARGDCNMGGMAGGEPATNVTIGRVAELFRYLGRRNGTEPQWIVNDLGRDHLAREQAA